MSTLDSRKAPLRLTICLAMCIAFGACELSETADGSATATVRDSAGITIVENPPVLEDALPFWSVDTVPAFTIGVLEGDPAYEFTSIKKVRQLPNGMIVVIDGRGESAYEFRFFDSTGRHIATHGRPGMGPGEFRWVSFVGAVGGDTVIAVDFPARRISWLSASHGFLRSTMVDEQRFKDLLGQDVGDVAESMTPLGDSLFATVVYRRSDGAGPWERYKQFDLVDLSRDSVVHVTRHDESSGTVRLQLSRGMSSFMTDVEMATGLDLVDHARQRLCAGSTRTPEIVCATAAGTRMVVRWQPDSLAYTADDRRSVEDRAHSSWLKSSYYGPGDADKILGAYVWPTHHNPVRTILTDADGNIWVLEPVRTATGAIALRFRILNPDGQQIAWAAGFELSPHRHINVSYFGSSQVLRKITDSDGVEVIGAFPIRK